MTVNTIGSIAEFVTNGVTTNYPFYFKFLANEDLVVTYVNPAGISSTLTLGTHYTVNGAGNDQGGSIVTTTALQGPGQLVVSREMVAFQQTSLRNQGKFLAETHEDVFDKLTMLIQQGFSFLGRALLRPPGKNYFDAAGRKINNLGSAEGVSSSAANYGDILQAVSLIPGPGLPINYVATISTMRNLLLTTPAVDNVEYNLREYISGTGKGGGVFYWSAGTLKSKHNGGTIISPTVPFSGLQAALPAFLAGTGETNPAGSGCWVRLYDDLYGEFFGMCGGAYRDPEAFSAAHKFAAQNFTTLHIDGHYYVAGAQVMGGRMLLQGHNNASLTGNLKYLCLTFPPAADTTTPITDTDPYFDSRGMAWKALEGDFALDVQAQYGDKFIDTCNINKNKFYGQLGFKGTHLIGGVMSDNDFYTTIAGVIQEGCTNWTYNEQRFRQAARYGMVWRPNAANPGRKGGENHKVSLCEFAVCTVGIRMIRTQWCSVDNSLFDYCGLPVWATGCLYQKYTDTYFGSSLQGSLQSMPGYTAPPTVGTAFYSEPYLSGTVAGGDAVVEPHGVTAIGCEFVNYTAGVTQPLFNATGFNPDQPASRLCQKMQLSKCKFIAGANHAASQLMSISYCTDADLDGLVFESFNKSTTMTDPFSLNIFDTYNVRGTNTYNCYQSGARMFSKYERESLGRLNMVDDTLGLLIQNVSGSNCVVVRGSGNDRVDMYVGGSLKGVGVGPVNSGGTGFRALIVPN